MIDYRRTEVNFPKFSSRPHFSPGKDKINESVDVRFDVTANRQ